MKSRTYLFAALLFSSFQSASAAEVWIVQGSSSGGTGTLANPYTIPTTDSTSFDNIINGLSQNTTVHVGAGLFLTQGTVPSAQSAIIPDGCFLLGSGVGVTTIKLANSSSSTNGVVIDLGDSEVASAKTTQGIRDLTVDCNMANQTATTIVAIGYRGFLVTIENVEIIHAGARDGESFGIAGGNYLEASVPYPSHVIIRNCKIHNNFATTSSSSGLASIHPSGNNAWSGVVEGCFIDLSDISSSQANGGGLCFAGSPHGLVFAHNTVLGASARGFHCDTPGSYSPIQARGVIVANNRFFDCLVGIAVGANNSNTAQDYFQDFIIEGNAIEMVRVGNGIELWGAARQCQIKNNLITKNTNAASGTRTGIYVSTGSQSNVVVGNRFGPSGDANFYPINPIDATYAAAMKSRFEDNTWTSDTLPYTVFHGFRNGSPISGAAYWRFSLGADEADSNPTSLLKSSDLDGSNPYTYFRVGRGNGGFVSGYNTWFDPSGTSGVYVGDQDSGDLAVGGWVRSNNLVLPPGGRLVITEGGSSDRMGVVQLGSGGAATVYTGSAYSSSRIFLTSQADGGTPGFLRVTSKTTGSFSIQSSSTSDTSTVAWLIVDPG